MTTDPYDQDTDRTFDQIIQHQQQRHPGGRTMTTPTPPRTSRDQATLLLGCGGFLLMLGLAVAVIIIAWRW